MCSDPARTVSPCRNKAPALHAVLEERHSLPKLKHGPARQEHPYRAVQSSTPAAGLAVCPYGCSSSRNAYSMYVPSRHGKDCGLEGLELLTRKHYSIAIGCTDSWRRREVSN